MATPTRLPSNSKIGMNVLHNVKVALSGLADKTVLATDQCLREADHTITQLQRWFPQLQVSVEENEKTWSRLGFNIRNVAKHAQEIYAPEHSNQYMLDHLQAAGESVRSPTREHALYSERGRATTQLRAFNEKIREVRSLHSECVTALKEKEYYHTKVETLRVNEGRKKKVTERDVDKRLRNEMKFSDVEVQLRLKWERLQRELEDVEACKESVLELVLLTYIKMQDYYFGRNPMGPVLSIFKQKSETEGPSPTRIDQRGTFDDVHRRAICEDEDEDPTAPPPSEVTEMRESRSRMRSSAQFGSGPDSGAHAEASGNASLYPSV